MGLYFLDLTMIGWTLSRKEWTTKCNGADDIYVYISWNSAWNTWPSSSYQISLSWLPAVSIKDQYCQTGRRPFLLFQTFIAMFTSIFKTSVYTQQAALKFVRIQEITLGKITSTELGEGGRYTSTLRGAEALASAFTIGVYETIWCKQDSYTLRY